MHGQQNVKCYMYFNNIKANHSCFSAAIKVERRRFNGTLHVTPLSG